VTHRDPSHPLTGRLRLPVTVPLPSWPGFKLRVTVEVTAVQVSDLAMNSFKLQQTLEALSTVTETEARCRGRGRRPPAGRAAARAAGGGTFSHGVRSNRLRRLLGVTDYTPSRPLESR
jgi:hypothetical protein